MVILTKQLQTNEETNSVSKKRIKRRKRLTLKVIITLKSLRKLNVILAPKKDKKKKPEQKVAAEETTPLVPEPVVVEEKKPVQKVVEKPVKAKKEPTPPPKEVPVEPAPKSKKSEISIPAGKMTEEEAEGVIQAVIKKLGGRVPKGSKVTLASNVEKLKAKNEELAKENQKTQKELSDQMTINFDIESKIQDAKKNAEQLEKQAKDALVRAQKAEKVGKEKETEFQRKIEVCTFLEIYLENFYGSYCKTLECRGRISKGG